MGADTIHWAGHIKALINSFATIRIDLNPVRRLLQYPNGRHDEISRSHRCKISLLANKSFYRLIICVFGAFLAVFDPVVIELSR